MLEAAACKRLQALTTAHLADACVRLGITLRCAPSAIKGIVPTMRCIGSIRPVRHAGSVDIFLEAIAAASANDVLVVDNDGRHDEACVGDLIGLETKQAGLSGIVIWGLHRDTAELMGIGLPLFSAGSFPGGPLRARPRHLEALMSAQIGEWCVSSSDVVVADIDGVLFLSERDLPHVTASAEQIRDTERRQAELMAKGQSLRSQCHFDEYLKKSREDRNYGFRQHLRTVAGAIET